VLRPAKKDHRWIVVLAGGDGEHLQPLTKFVCGDDRPKQFCPLFGGRTLLGQTLKRAYMSIPGKQVLVSLSGQHYKFYSQEPDLSPSQRIAQPMNKGTAPAIVHSLLSIAQMDEQALVAILPSDHHYSDEGAFRSALNDALEVAADQPDTIVLLGVRPSYVETEYGWIELGTPVCPGKELYRVRRFQEKPNSKAARVLFEQGAVWNTFVMAGRVGAFLELVRKTIPGLLNEIGQARLWAGEETHIEYSLYLRLSTSNFSHDVLSLQSERLLVLRLNNTEWSDLGNPRRVASVIRETGCEPGWFKTWDQGDSRFLRLLSKPTGRTAAGSR
jgi:mannose-1-phosphate guanylyltransferase